MKVNKRRECEIPRIERNKDSKMASFNDKSWAIRSSTIPKEAVDKEFSNLFITANKNDSSDVDGASSDVSSPGPNMAPFNFKTMHDTGSLHSRRSIYSSTTDANCTYSTVKPLSWREARMKLCDILKSYVLIFSFAWTAAMDSWVGIPDCFGRVWKVKDFVISSTVAVWVDIVN